MNLLAAVALAAPQPGDYDPSTGKGSEWGKAAPIGLLVILLLGIAVFFLLRSFTRQLKKVPVTFDPTDPGGAAPDEPAARSAADPARVAVPPDDGPERDDGPAPGVRGPAGAAEPPG